MERKSSCYEVAPFYFHHTLQPAPAARYRSGLEVVEAGDKPTRFKITTTMKNRDINSKLDKQQIQEQIYLLNKQLDENNFFAKRIWENTCDWGYPGQMQVNSKELTLTRCIKRVENCPTWGEYSVWKNYSFASADDLEKAMNVFADCSLVG